MKFDGVVDNENYAGKRYYGKALCSNTQGAYASVGQPDAIRPGPHCWCKIPSSSWVVASDTGVIDTDWCIAHCADLCAERVLNGWKYFRRALGLDF